MAEEKKEGFWSKFKNSIKESQKESKLEDAYRKNHDEYTLYSGVEIFNAKAVYGELNESTFTLYGKHELKVGDVIELKSEDTSKELDRFYLVLSFDNTLKDKVKIKEEVDEKEVENEYEVDVTKVEVKKAKEVKVTKAGDKYFLIEE